MSNKTKIHNPYKIVAKGDNEAELLIYGDIGDSWWGESVEAKDIVEQLQEIDAEYLTVRINSFGGAVADGIAIHNAIKRHDAVVTVVIEGVAVSIASLIAMSGDTIEMGENALFMIHAPWMHTAGNSAELRKHADMLDKWSEAMATSYANKTGKPLNEILDILKGIEDHWFTAQEALDEGYADVITQDDVDIAAHGFAQSKFASGLPGQLKQFAAKGGQKTQDVHMKVKVDTSELTKAKELAAEVAATLNNNGDTKMSEKDKNKAAEPKAVNENEVRAQVIASDKERKTGIRAAFKPFVENEGVQVVLDTCLDNMDCSVSDANSKLLAHIGKDAEPLAKTPRIEVIQEASAKFHVGVQAALMARSNMGAEDYQNEYRGYSLLEIARQTLAMHGVNTTSMGKMDMVAAAFTHTSSDFTNLLANVANKAMLKGYDEAEETFQSWTTVGELGDFKEAKRVDLNSFPSLDKVRDGAEYKSATMGDRGEAIQLATYGKLFSITRQTIINDDLSAFTRIPMKMGRAAIRTVGDLVYAVLTANPAMSDGTALFHADHNNLLSAAAINSASVDLMRVGMGIQKDGDANLNIRLANLLVPMALEGVAKVVRDSEFEVGASNKNNTVPNSVRGTFDVISDSRLDTASSSNWYGSANPAMHDTVEVSYLDGNSAPQLEQQAGWNVDGTEFKVRIDAGVSPLDFRTMSKNPN